jgi:hypothetical protein
MVNPVICTLVVVSIMLACSCSNTTASKVTSGPGDPQLTYDLVMRSVDDYKGKRVRWYGTQMSFESKGGGTTRVVYGNTQQWQAGGQMQAFVVEYQGDLMEIMKLPQGGWVTGTIEGTHSIATTLGSPSGRETRTHETVPLLSHAEIKGATKQE